MKKLFLISLIFSHFLSFSQDLIITNQNDSINCSIIRKTNKNYYYTVGKDTTNLKITISEVSSCYYGYYSRLNSKKNTKSIFGKLSKEETNYQYDFLSIGLFTSRNFMYKHPERMLQRKMNDNYNNLISSGWCFGGNLSYYMNKYIGLGIRGNYFSSSAIEDSLPYTHSYFDSDSVLHQDTDIGYLSDKIEIFNAEFYITAKYNFKRSYIYGDIGISIFKFKNTHYDYYVEQKFQGECFGISLNLGYDIKIIKYLAIGINTSYSAASLKTISINGYSRNLSNNSIIKLNRFTVGLNLKIWLSKK